MGAIRHALDKQVHKRLPRHTGWWHVFGSLALMLFISQVLSGILLLVYYRPTPAEAHNSIEYITGEAHFGWLFRQIHAWGSTFMILAVLAHMARTFFWGAYKKPRELTWIVGVLIFVVTITFGFTGYLLPWNQVSYWATMVGTQISGAIPVVGESLQRLLRGGESVGNETLSRFFTVHAVVLPWVMVLLIAIHLFLVRMQNLATLDPVGQEPSLPPDTGIPFYPVHVSKEGCVALMTLGILITASVLWPWEMGAPADPLRTPEAIKPEWYFLPTYQLLKYFGGPWGKVLGILCSMVPIVLLLIWPFVDRSPHRRPRRRPLSMTIGAVAIAAALILGVLGHLSERTVTIFGRQYHFDLKGIPTRVHDERGAAGQVMTRGEFQVRGP